MPRESFQYAVIRLVPRIEREEFINVGVIVFCRRRGLLTARVAHDPRRALALAPDADLDGVSEELDAIVRIAAGQPDAGPIAALSQSERFHWLVAPKSTMVQTSSVHSGICDDPERMVDHLFDRLVAP